MSPMQSDPNTTSPINRDELRALLRRARDIEAHTHVASRPLDRAVDVVVDRAALSAWIEARR